MGAPVGRGILLHLLNQVGDDFGVGFSHEPVTLRDQFALQCQVILNNAVVHHHDAPGAISVGVGILLGGTAMGGPPRMADAERAFEGMVAQHFFQVVQLARGPRHRELIASRAADGDSGRIIAAVFEAPQPLDNDRNDFLRADIANNAAHTMILRYFAPATQ